MGHSSGVEAACRVLPIIDEESESESESESEGGATPESKRKAIVSRMRELIRRAAAQSAQTPSLRSTVLVNAKKWKRAVSFQNRRNARTRKQQLDDHQETLSQQGDEMSSSSVSSKSSFSWDVAAEVSCCSSTMWPAAPFVSGQAEMAADHGVVLSSPATDAAVRLSSISCASTTSSGSAAAADMIGLLRGGSSPAGAYRGSGGDVKMMSARMAHWITTDSDFVVLEL